jgi:hypothetical protein
MKKTWFHMSIVLRTIRIVRTPERVFTAIELYDTDMKEILYTWRSYKRGPLRALLAFCGIGWSNAKEPDGETDEYYPNAGLAVINMNQEVRKYEKNGVI